MASIPPMLAGRPTWHGMAVPYSVFIDADGRPQFRIIDHDAVAACVKHRLCGICGHALGRKVVFIGGERSLASRCFLDPPMHHDCAHYALEVCPFLKGDQRNMKSALPPVGEEHALAVMGDVPIERPARMGFLTTKTFMAVTSGQHLVFRAGDPTLIEYFEGDLR